MGTRLRHTALALAAAAALVAGAAAPVHAISVTFTGMIDTFSLGNDFGIDAAGTFVNGGASYTAPIPGGEANPFIDPEFGFDLQIDPAPVGQPGVLPSALLFSWFEDINYLLFGPTLNPFLAFDGSGALAGIDTLVYFNYAPGTLPYGDTAVSDSFGAAYEFSMAGQNFTIASLVDGGIQDVLVAGHFDFTTVQPGEFQPVPEPGTLLLLGSGLLGLAGRARRWRQR